MSYVSWSSTVSDVSLDAPTSASAAPPVFRIVRYAAAVLALTSPADFGSIGARRTQTLSTFIGTAALRVCPSPSGATASATTTTSERITRQINASLACHDGPRVSVPLSVSGLGWEDRPCRRARGRRLNARSTGRHRRRCTLHDQHHVGYHPSPTVMPIPRREFRGSCIHGEST